MSKIKCPVCGQEGTLILKTTKSFSKGKMYTYQKFYVYHNKTRRQKWCYISREHLENQEIKSAIADYTKLHKAATQNENSNLSLISGKWSLGRDLDPRPPPYQGDAPPG